MEKNYKKGDSNHLKPSLMTTIHQLITRRLITRLESVITRQSRRPKISTELLTLRTGNSQTRGYRRQHNPVHYPLRFFHSSGTDPQPNSQPTSSESGKLYPICPTCSIEIRANFNQTSKIEEKCKCANCQSFIPTDMVIKKIPERDRSVRKSDNEGEEEGHEAHRIDYFKLFEVEKTFKDLDLVRLKKAYHQWQQVVHPDFSINNDQLADHPSELSLQCMKDWSVLVNRAKSILSDDLKRAEYLIGLHGTVELSQEADSLDNSQLLVEIMEVREQLEEAQTAEAIESIKRTNKGTTFILFDQLVFFLFLRTSRPIYIRIFRNSDYGFFCCCRVNRSSFEGIGSSIQPVDSSQS
ncbi:hypothetical protein PGT21_017126 [Puccinia graminis f. sp. tritici]|uniref:J domain-containing protein n=1 Tax=Puccinia graminis f. sp. tritici TaxID=56615 RepID=A0A5B0R104_PUCGR|nr:hypothetical protein PGT21_017126 [Puccinia graminis f. sp. tritici]